MSIEIKISKKPIEYNKAINYLEKRVKSKKNNGDELLWILSHPSTYTEFQNTEILDKKNG